MVGWGAKHDPDTPVPQNMIDLIKHDKAAFMDALLDKRKD